jgi:hypothetical protein
VKKIKLTLQTPVQKSEKALFRDFGGESVLLLLDRGIYYGLNEAGSRIWELLSDHDSLETIAALLAKEYEVPEKRCAKDLLVLAEGLLEEGLLETKTAPSTCVRS